MNIRENDLYNRKNKGKERLLKWEKKVKLYVS